MSRIGFWKWTNETHDPVPLYTRYQRAYCRGSKESEPRCLEAGSLDRFLPYRYHFFGSPEINMPPPPPMILNKNSENKNPQYLQRYHHLFDPTAEIDSTTNKTTMGTKLIPNDPVTICLSGLSHARELATHFRNIVDEFNFTNWNWNNVKIKSIEMRYPHEMHSGNAKRILRYGCNVTIVSLVQWSAGRKPRYPRQPATTLPEYKNQLEKGIADWQYWNVSFVFRQPHYNALGDWKHECPPQDRRWPAVIDGYNQIIKALAVKANVKYIDTGDIMDAMWDSSGDFNHYKEESGRIEALYLLRQVQKYLYE